MPTPYGTISTSEGPVDPNQPAAPVEEPKEEVKDETQN